MRHFLFTVTPSKRFAFKKEYTLEQELTNDLRSEKFHYAADPKLEAILRGGDNVIIPANSREAAKRMMRGYIRRYQG